MKIAVLVTLAITTIAFAALCHFFAPADASEKPAAPIQKPDAPAVQPADKGAPEKKLAPLNDYADLALDEWLRRQGEVPCGLACPKCGKELLLNTAILLNTVPPRKLVRCPDTEKCKWHGSTF